MTEVQITKATFTARSGPNTGKAMTVHFNPASLEYTVQNRLEEQGQGAQRQQFVSSSTGKLGSVDIVVE